MKRTITTVAVACACLLTASISSAFADDEVVFSSSRSPLLPNFYPAAGQWILESNYAEMELMLNSNWNTKLQKFEQSLRYRITDQTEISMNQAYAISQNGKDIGEFSNPSIGIEHRLEISDSEHIYAVGFGVRPEVPYAGYQPSLKQQQVFSKLSWKIGPNIWLGAQGKYTNAQQITSASNIEIFSVQFSVSKSWEENSASFGIGLNKTSDYTGRVLYLNPIALTSVASEISPTATASLSHSFRNSFYGIFDFAWQSLRNSTTFLGQYENLGTRTNTTPLQTVTARLVKEF